MRTFELFRSIGLGPALDQFGWSAGAPMKSVFKDRAFGAVQHVSGLPQRYAARLETCTPVDVRRSVTQLEVQKLALDHLDEGTVRFGVRLRDFDLRDSKVHAHVVDTRSGEPEEIVADYLIAADGAGSDVRERLGITVPDRRVVASLNTAFFRADLGDVVNEWGTGACFVRNEHVYATLFSKNGKDQWSSHIMDYPGKPEGLAELSEQKTVELLRAAIGDDRIDIDLHAVNAWEAALGIASKLRHGRVFLVGDAAHVQSSAGGLGMNTGIQDGHNLAWKIAAVLAGQAAPSLLDSYEPERLSAVEAALALSQRMHEGYQNQNPDQMYEAIAIDYLRGMMFYGYRSGAIIDDGPSEADVLTDVPRPGYRFPHHWVEPNVSTLDLIGARWSVLSATPLQVDDPGIRVHEVSDVVPPGEAVLVRPDGFVAWHGQPVGLHAALHRILGHEPR